MRARSLFAFAAIVAACHSKTSSDGTIPTDVPSAIPIPTTIATTAPTTSAPKPNHAPQFHRASANACPGRPPSGIGTPHDFVHDDPAKPPSPKECATDADCKKGKNGRCIHEEHRFRGTMTGTGYRCSYDDCNVDADCGEGNACLCRDALGSGPTNVCVVAGCKTDADCSGSTCSPSYAPMGGSCRSEGVPYQALRCHGPDDECVDDSDCTRGKDCVYLSAKKRWVCDAYLCMPD